jgi:hypothetical protein
VRVTTVNSQRQNSPTFELVNERRSFAQPFEPLPGCQAVKFGMAVEILQSALGERALEFFGRLDFLRRFITKPWS